MQLCEVVKSESAVLVIIATTNPSSQPVRHAERDKRDKRKVVKSLLSLRRTINIDVSRLANTGREPDREVFSRISEHVVVVWCDVRNMFRPTVACQNSLLEV